MSSIEDHTSNQPDDCPPSISHEPWPGKRLRIENILVAFLVTPLIIFGAIRALEESGTKTDDWLPDSFEETQRLREFSELFGSDELLMISWPNLKVGSDETAVLRDQLLSADQTDARKRVFFDEVWTGDSVADAMQSPPLNLSKRQSIARMKGWILGAENQTAAVALVSIAGIEDRRAAVQFARRVATEVSGRELPDVRLAGSTIETVAIDEASKESLLLLNVVSAIVCIALILICVRSLFYALTIFLIAMFFQLSAMALIYFTGGQMDSILLLTANLACVLSISASIHMFGYYREALDTDSISNPVLFALRRAALPTSLAALTTAIGFGSLAISDVTPIKNFGFYSAIIAPISVMLSLWFLSMYLSNRSRDPAGTGCPEKSTDPGNDSTDTAENGLFAAHDSLQARRLPQDREPFCQRFRIPIFVTTAAVFAVGCTGMMRLKTSVGIHDLFPQTAKLIQDYSWLEKAVGPLVSIETIVMIPGRDARPLAEELRVVATIQRSLLQVEEIGTTYSALNYCPPEVISKPRGRSLRSLVSGRVFETQRGKVLDSFESFRLVSQEPNKRYWRISARVHASIPQDFPILMGKVQRAAQDAAQSAGDGITVRISGGVPLAAKTQQRLLADLGKSYLAAFLLIAVTIGIVLKSPVAGLLTLLPNLAPALVAFGTMGLMQWPAGIGGVMTASVVLGIAVDDSLHFVLAFRASYASGHERSEAVQDALQTCRPAIIQTSVVCGFGMLVFLLSPFIPIQRFALLMFSLLAIALAANLLLLPAILHSRCGEYFRERTHR